MTTWGFRRVIEIRQIVEGSKKVGEVTGMR